MTIGGSRRADQSRLQQVELRSAVHLPLHELELGDLALRLAVRPRLGDSGANGGFVLGDARGKRREQAGTGVSSASGQRAAVTRSSRPKRRPATTRTMSKAVTTFAHLANFRPGAAAA
jgi:hypothetical protein